MAEFRDLLFYDFTFTFTYFVVDLRQWNSLLKGVKSSKKRSLDRPQGDSLKLFNLRPFLKNIFLIWHIFWRMVTNWRYLSSFSRLHYVLDSFFQCGSNWAVFVTLMIWCAIKDKFFIEMQVHLVDIITLISYHALWTLLKLISN